MHKQVQVVCVWHSAVCAVCAVRMRTIAQISVSVGELMSLAKRVSSSLFETKMMSSLMMQNEIHTIF